MNGRTFSKNPCKRGKSHHSHPQTVTLTLNDVLLSRVFLSNVIKSTQSDIDREYFSLVLSCVFLSNVTTSTQTDTDPEYSCLVSF